MCLCVNMNKGRNGFKKFWLSRGRVLLGESTLFSFAVLRKLGMFLFCGDNTMEFCLV